MTKGVKNISVVQISFSFPVVKTETEVESEFDMNTGSEISFDKQKRRLDVCSQQTSEH